MKILALESSTSAAKAMLFDTAARKTLLETKAFPHMYDDITLQDAETIFKTMLDVARTVLDTESRIDMISLGGTWHSFGIFDKKMHPLIPMMPWNCTWASDLCLQLRKDKAYTDNYYNMTGCMVNASYPFFKLKLANKKKQIKDLSNCRIGGQGTYNNYRFTGRYAVTECEASGSGFLDIRKLTYHPMLLEESKIDEGPLPEIIKSTETRGLLKEIASYLGIQSGTPVILTNSDGGLNQIGTDALGKGTMTFSIGTSAAIRLSVDKPALSKSHSTWCYYSPKTWLSGAATSGACNCIDWYKNLLSPMANWKYSEFELPYTVKTDIPVFLPFIFGERCPGWQDTASGIFMNLKPDTSIYDLYTAIQEGILFNIYQCYNSLVSINYEPHSIQLSGGILHSPSWVQMCTDIFNRPIEIDRSTHGSLVGGIALSMDILDIQEKEYIQQDRKAVYPITSHHDLYMKHYSKYLDYYDTYVKEGNNSHIQ
ncbi:MAG: hypothetical protein LKE40_12410 [Spirochaetia bacterium]|jgi:gluconokinase|nr:hypothetical protein [Spirochaetia bacterium]